MRCSQSWLEKSRSSKGCDQQSFGTIDGSLFWRKELIDDWADYMKKTIGSAKTPKMIGLKIGVFVGNKMPYTADTLLGAISFTRSFATEPLVAVVNGEGC